MKYILALLISVFCSSFVFAQITFDKTYSPDAEQKGRELFQTSDDGYLMQGTILNNWYNCYLIRTDEFGDTLWTKTFGNDSSVQYYTFDVINTTDGGFVLTGDFQMAGANQGVDSYIQKVDSAGNELWFNVFGIPINLYGGKDFGDQLRLLNNGQILTHGESRDRFLSPTNYFSSSVWSSYIATFDENSGTILDMKSIQAIFKPNSWQRWVTRDVEVINNKIFVIGTYQEFGSSPFEFGFGIINQNFDSVYTQLGNFRQYLGLSKTNDDHLLLFDDSLITKMDTTGNITWSVANTANGYPAEFIETTNGNLVSISNGNSWADLFDGDFHNFVNYTVHINYYSSSGNLLWSKNVATNGNSQFGYKLIQTSDNGYALCGFKNNDIWLLKMDSVGNVITSVTYPVSNSFELSINPNPAKEFFILNASKEIEMLFIFNMEGKLVHEEQVNTQTKQININGLSPGVYIYKATHKNEVTSGKFSIE